MIVGQIIIMVLIVVYKTQSIALSFNVICFCIEFDMKLDDSSMQYCTLRDVMVMV